MSEFKHSIVLFTGDDGLPLEFNVRNTNEKAHLKALIEHGGGFCTQNENSVHLISPGTKVLNVDLGKKLVSSSYIYECVKQNYLLDVNEYVFTISEAQTSDISDEDSERLLTQRQSTCKSPCKKTSKMNVEISPIKPPNISNETTPSNLTLPSSNSALPPICNSSESFVEGSQEASSYKITSHVYYGKAANPSNEKIKSPQGLLENSEDFNPSQSLVLPSKCAGLVDDIKSHLNLRSPLKQAGIAGGNVKNHLNLQSPLKSTDFLDDEIPNPSTSKPAELLKDNTKNPLNYSSPSKQAALFVEDVKNPLNLQSPVKNIPNAVLTLPNSPQNPVETHKKRLVTSPKKQVDISPIMRADPKRVNKNYIGQPLKLPVQNCFQELPGSILLERDVQDKDINKKENDSLPPRNQLLPSVSPVKSIDDCLEHPNPLLGRIEIAHDTSAIVSSSQPEDELDKFDNMLLSKALQKPLSEEGDSSSQTCTVSSSADAQVSSKPCSAEDNSQPLQAPNSDNLPDSPNLSSSEINEDEYIRRLEVEVEQILEKPPPRTIQDKITLVKYACCARKLTPRIFLESLLSNDNSLEIQ